MRYEGKTETVKSIEEQIRKNAMCFQRKMPKYDNLFGIESAVETVVFDVLIPKEAYLFPIRLLYDNRESTLMEKRAVLDVRDKDVWWLCKIAPGVLKLMGQLEPQQQEKQDMLNNKTNGKSSENGFGLQHGFMQPSTENINQ